MSDDPQNPGRKPPMLHQRLWAWGRRRLGFLLVLLALVLLGGLGGRQVGVWLALDDTQAMIEGVTRQHADRTHANYDAVRDLLIEVNLDTAGRCSPANLAAMRTMAFDSTVVADLGRLSNGHLICTTGIGNLVEPLAPVEADYISPTGVRWYANVDVLISEQTHALVLELGTANAVIHPMALVVNTDPHVKVAILAIDPETGQVLQGAGDQLPVDPERAVAALSGRADYAAMDGYVSALACASGSIICVVSMESEADAIASGELVITVVTAAGMAVAVGAFLAVVLAFHRDRSVSTRLRRAIRADRLHVEYQPQIDLVTREVVGAEALVRWTDSAGVRHRPDVFVAIAENHGFVSALTDLVIRHVVQDMADVLLARPDLHIAINFAAADLTDGRLVERLDRAALQADIAPAQFAIELTERAAGDDPRVKATLAAARAAGHKIAIDDFGVGYSNLTYLQTMPIDCLKVDKSFTDTIGTGSVRATIVPHLLDMAHALDLSVVVEGVETEAQVAYFVDRGVRVGQGWAFARAMPAPQFKTWLQEWNAPVAKPMARSA